MGLKPYGAMRFFLIAITAMAVTVPAYAAQENDVPTASGRAQVALDTDPRDIVVTAARRSQNLQDVAMSVDVATGETLQKLNILDIKDVQKLSPGLQLSNSSGRSAAATLRGITFEPDQGTSPSVDLYINDVPADASTAFTAIYDVEQIEVLRGPQGALRGRTAPAGAITLRTRRPDMSDINGYVQGTVSDQNAYNLQGAVSLPIISDKLAIRTAFLIDGNRINQVRNVTNGQRSQSNTQSARVSLRWTPNSDVDANLIYHYLTSDDRFVQQVIGSGNTPALGSTQRSGPAADINDYIGVSEGDRRFRNNSHFVTGTLDWNFGNVALQTIASYQFSQLVQQFDQDAGNSIPNYINVSEVRIPYSRSNFEARLVSDNSGFWNWTLSAFYNKLGDTVTQSQKADTFFGNFPANARVFLPITLDLEIPQYDRTISVAAGSRFEFTPQFTLEVGVRYTDQRKKQFAYSTVNSPGYAFNPNYPFFPARNPINNVTSSLVPDDLAIGHGKALTGIATLSYEINPDITTYLAYGRSFRLGSAGVGVPANLSADLVRSGNERSDSYEWGIKTQLFDRRLRANFSAYYQKYDGHLVRLPHIFYDFGSRNAFGQAVGAPDGLVDGVFPSGFNYNGDASIKGVEASLNARFTDNIDLSLGANYARGRFKDASLPCNDFNGDGMPDTIGTPRVTGSGNVSYCQVNGRLAEIPDFNMNANAEFRVPMGNMEPFISTLVTYRPSFSYWRTGYDYSAMTLVNLYFGVRNSDAGWEIKGFAKNLLNQKRIVNVLGNASVPTANINQTYQSGYTLISSSLPRELGLSAIYNF